MFHSEHYNLFRNVLFFDIGRWNASILARRLHLPRGHYSAVHQADVTLKPRARYLGKVRSDLS